MLTVCVVLNLRHFSPFFCPGLLVLPHADFGIYLTIIGIPHSAPHACKQVNKKSKGICYVYML